MKPAVRPKEWVFPFEVLLCRQVAVVDAVHFALGAVPKKVFLGPKRGDDVEQGVYGHGHE